MNTVRAVLRALIRLFVDDGSLAFQVVAAVFLAEISEILFPSIPLAAGSVLLIGCLGVLFVSVARASSH
jgi:hypothetical protein